MLYQPDLDQAVVDRIHHFGLTLILVLIQIEHDNLCRRCEIQIVLHVLGDLVDGAGAAARALKSEIIPKTVSPFGGERTRFVSVPPLGDRHRHLGDAGGHPDIKHCEGRVRFGLRRGSCPVNIAACRGGRSRQL